MSFQRWIIKRQCQAEVDVLMALADRPREWRTGEQLGADVRISPWRFLGALNRLTHSKKVHSMITPNGGRAFALTDHGWSQIQPREEPALPE